MSASNLLISVVICNHNYADYVADAIASVVAQSYQNYELVIVDDGSTDSSQQVISSCLRHLAGRGAQVKLICQENLGQAKALAAGVKAATGEWICFLDSDDRFKPHKLSVLAHYIEAYPEAGSIWHRSNTFGSDNLHESLYKNQGVWPPKPRLSRPIKVVNSTAIDDYDAAYTTNSCLAIQAALAGQIAQAELRDWPHKHYGDVFFDRPAQIMAPVLWIPEILSEYRIHSRSHHLGNINVAARENLALKKKWLEEKYSLVNAVLNQLPGQRPILLEKNLVWLDLKLALAEISVGEYFYFAARLKTFWLTQNLNRAKGLIKFLLSPFVARFRSSG